MIKNGKNKNILSYAFLRIVWKLFEVDSKTRFYGTDEQLFEAEIHLIKAIKENDGIHVTGLAEILGVTKGAVSQLTMKLQKKGMIIKDADPQNLSRLILRLTPKGEIAYNSHEKLHQKFDMMFNELLEKASKDNIKFLKEFMESLENKIDYFEQ